MKTRRSKGTEAGQDESPILEVDIPTDLDISSLEEKFPEVSLRQPTAQAIISVYRLLLEQTHQISSLSTQLEESLSNIMRKDVELDQTLQEQEVRFKELDQSLASRAAEIEVLKKENKQLLATQESLESDRTRFSQSHSVHASEVDSLKIKLTDLEREKRDLVGVIARLRSEDEQREDETKTLRSNLKQVRREMQEVQARVSEMQSTETTQQFKIQYLEQQVELSRSAAETAAVQLDQKSEELVNYRREKHAEIVSLSSSLDAMTANHSSTQAAMSALQQSNSDKTRRLTEALQKISEVEGRLADQTASYRLEAGNQSRLIELLESRNEQARARVEEIESEWDRMLQLAEERQAQLISEIEREKSRADRLEGILEEVHADRGRHGDGGSSEVDPVSKPDTMFNLSPAADVAAKLQRTGRSFTQVYGDYIKLQEELTKSQTERRRLEDLMSQILADLEERTPLLTQQRHDFERTKQEADQLASQLAAVLSERDTLKLHASGLEKQVRAEKLLVNQLELSSSDLGRQVQHLLRRLAVTENPALDELPPRPVVNSELLSADLALGNDEVVLFENIASLQAQNQLLLQVAHRSALALDQKEREFRQSLANEESEALSDANAAIIALEEQLQSQQKNHEIKLQAYIKELEYHKTRSFDRDPRGIIPTVAPAPSSDEVELRNHLDAYRLESEKDSSRLREEISRLQVEANKLSVDLAKANGTIQFLSEHQRLHKEAQQLKERELESLNKRCQGLRDQTMRLEIAYSQATDNLTQATSQLDRLRSENANLLAERALWNDIETRLSTDNKTLARERNHLAELVGNIQRVHDDLDKANERDRQRQETQLQNLAAQNQDLRNQLSQERDQVRSISLQKEIDVKQLHDRLETALREHSSSVTALAEADAKKVQLQARIEDLSKRTEAQEEKLLVYERRGPSSNADGQGSQTQLIDTDLAQLRADLKTAQIELSHAKEHVEQYKSISESNEQAFAQLSSTFEQLQSTSRKEISDKDAELRGYLERIAALQSEVEQISHKNTELQQTMEADRTVFKREQQSLEARIVDLTTAAANVDNDASLRATEIQEKEQQLQAVQRKYEEAVKAHAEAITLSDNWKARLGELQATVRESEVRADTAQSKLSLSEASWTKQRELLDKEMADVNKRCQGLTEQNELLHQQLQTLSSQAARIRQVASARVEDSQDTTSEAEVTEQQLNDLRSVISYLRKEKEISELHMELSKQESARSKAEVEHLTRVLDETRLLLSEERDRAAESATSTAEHAELVERINQVNLLRESNALLRSEAGASKERMLQLESDLTRLSTELEPLRQKLLSAEAVVESRDSQLEQSRKEIQHWQERNQQILSKYDRVDPAELQDLKSQLQDARMQIDEATARAEEATKRATAETEMSEKFKRSLQQHRDALNKLRAQAKAKRDEAEQQKQQDAQEIESLKTERDALVTKINTELSAEVQRLQGELETLRAEYTDVQQILETERTARESVPQSDKQDPPAELIAERDALIVAKRELELALEAASHKSDESGLFTQEERLVLLSAKETALQDANDAKASQAVVEEELSQAKTSMHKLLEDLRLAQDKITQLELKNDSSSALDELRAKHALELEAAVVEAKSHALADLPQSGPNLHDELKALETRLKEQHGKEVEELKTTLLQEKEKAVNDAKAAQLTQTEAEVTALRAEVESLAKAKEEAHQQGMEQGRKEVSTKLKLKESQFAKLSKKLQEVEQTLAANTASGQTETVTTPTPDAPVTPSPTPSTAPRQNSAQTPLGIGRGRGVSMRGAAGRGRGAAAAATSSTIPIPQTPATSILGAAAKRSRDSEGEGTTESLAKRIKPGAPVSIVRNRVLPSDPGAS